MKQNEEIKKPHVCIGTIGHVDHGKDSLTKAILKVLEKNFPSEEDGKTCEEENTLTLHKSYKNLK